MVALRKAEKRRKGRIMIVKVVLMMLTFIVVFDSLDRIHSRALLPSSSQLRIIVDPPTDDLVCASARSYFTDKALTESLVANNKYHKLGGSLKSVQLFKDSQMDSTIRKFNLEFEPAIQGAERTQELTTFLKPYYAKNYDPRGGYGNPLPGHFIRKGQSEALGGILFEDRWVDVQEATKGRAKWDAALGPIGPTCQNLRQLGTKDRDGYKYLCLPETMKNREQEARVLDGDFCHVISVGGNDNWKFEIAIADLGCITHTFDCTLPGDKPRRKPNRPDIHFYPHCIDGRTHTDEHGRSYLSYNDMLEMAGIKDKAPTYFKMDVEGFEYDIFATMIQNTTARHLLPQQIQVELHWATRMTGVEWMPRTRTSGEIALLSNMMYNGGGYMPIHLDFNPGCSTCMEVLYFRTVCAAPLYEERHGRKAPS